jgi:abhydrolase domain-containing protein 17
MGNVMQRTKDSVIAPIAFCPPPEAVGRNTINIIDCSGYNIAVKLITGEQKDKLIIFSHGNGDDLTTSLNYQEFLQKVGDWSVLSYDYFGYGFSSHKQTTEKNMGDCIEAVAAYATRHLKFKKENIMLIGKSLGSVPTLHLATHVDYSEQICGTILVSPLASGSRVMLANVPKMPSRVKDFFDSICFDNLHKISEVERPVFMIHGISDQLITKSHTEALLLNTREAFRYNTLFLRGGHNDIEELNKTLITNEIKKFTKYCEEKTTCDYNYE